MILVERLALIVSAVSIVVAITVVIRGVLRREPAKRIRERSCAAALVSVIGLRGVVPNTALGLTAYFGAMVLLVVVALWKGKRAVSSSTPAGGSSQSPRPT